MAVGLGWPGRRFTGPHQQHLAARVIDDEARVRTEALGARSKFSIAGDDEQVGARARLYDLALDPPPAGVQLRCAPEPGLRRLEQRLRFLGGDRTQRRPRRGRRTAAQQPRGATRRNVLDVGWRHVQERDLGVVGQKLASAVYARLPGALGYPDDRSHHKTCRANHNPSVEATRINGTVRTPSRVNSPMSVSSSWAWTIRRHSSVASDPT